MNEISSAIALPSVCILPAAIALGGALGSAAYAYPQVVGQDYEQSVTQSADVVKTPLTAPVHAFVVSKPPRGQNPLVANENQSVAWEPLLSEREEVMQPDLMRWVEHAYRSKDWVSAYQQFSELLDLEPGWDGPDSQAASLAVLVEAEYLLGCLEDCKLMAPMVGLDDDGIVVLSWARDGVFGSLSVFGDETYSFYVESEGRVASDGEASVDADIPHELVKLLSS